MNITEKILLRHNFNLQKIVKHGHDWPDWTEYECKANLKEQPHIYYRIRIMNCSNTVGRDWFVHVDNDVCMTCGSLDVQTIEQFNTFMNLLDINFQLEEYE